MYVQVTRHTLKPTCSWWSNGECDGARADHESPGQHAVLDAHEGGSQDRQQDDVTPVHQTNNDHVYHYHCRKKGTYL